MEKDEDILKQMLTICKEILEQWDLFVNEDKVEFIRFHIAGKDELDDKGESLKNREPRRKALSLGSRFCSTADITHRCILGNAAFEKYNKYGQQDPVYPLLLRSSSMKPSLPLCCYTTVIVGQRHRKC